MQTPTDAPFRDLDAGPPPLSRSVRPSNPGARLGLFILLLLGSCANVQPLDATDATASIATARVQIGLAEPAGASPEREREAAAGRRTASSIDLAGTYARGDLDVADPTGVRATYELIEVQLALAGRKHEGPWDVGGFLGLQIDHLDIDLRSRASTDNQSFFGPLVGFELGMEPIDRLRPYLRASAAALVPGALVVQGELGVDLRLVDALHITGGYRYWQMAARSVTIWGTDATLDVRLHGPFVGIHADF